MGTISDYQKELMNVTRGLPESRLHELLDFARFLKSRSEGFSYSDVEDSGEYVRSLREEEGKKAGTSEKFIGELLEWQRSNLS